MKHPYCPECHVRLDIYPLTYEFQCPECEQQFFMDCEDDMQQIEWK